MHFFNTTFARTAIALSTSLLFSGCCCLSGAMNSAQQAAQDAQMRTNLKVLALTYHDYLDTYNKGPADWDELMKVAEPGDTTFQEVRAAGYRVAWGVSMDKVSSTIGVANFVLAHRPQDEATGGTVLMLDSSVRDMSATELADALKQRESM